MGGKNSKPLPKTVVPIRYEAATRVQNDNDKIITDAEDKNLDKPPASCPDLPPIHADFDVDDLRFDHPALVHQQPQHKFNNGLPKILPKNKSLIPWYEQATTKKKILAIDFGTSTLVVAYYSPKQTEKSDPIIIKFEKVASIPTVLYIELGTNEVEIGNEAFLKYCEYEAHIGLFFKKVKLSLHDDENVGERSYVYGSDGKCYYLIEVIAVMLHKLRQELDTYFELRGRDEHKIEEFHWVLTVPAIWGKQARNMMRKAACLAGLCSSKFCEKLLPLRPTYTHDPLEVDKELQANPENLSLVYEPDAAAAWCRNLTPDKAQGPDAQPPLTTEDYFFTVDVGGGTIDVTGHQMLDNGRMKRLALPHGEMYGGTLINERFKTEIENLVDDPHLSRYLLTGGTATDEQKRAELFHLLYDEFEKYKVRFGEHCGKYQNRIELPESLIDTYNGELLKLNGSDFQYKNRQQTLHISAAKMEKFFELSANNVMRCIDKSIEDIKERNKLKIIYLVGGFGGCVYISKKIRAKYATDTCRVIIPDDPELSIVKGACLYHESNILEKADATYGIKTCMPYDKTNPVHIKGKKISTDDNEEFCDNLFQPFIQVNDDLKKDQVYVASYIPIDVDQTTLPALSRWNFTSKPHGFILFSTDKEYVDYTDGEDLNQCATILIDTTGTGEKIELLIDFTGTEILVFAILEKSRHRVKVSVEFSKFSSNRFENVPFVAIDTIN